jgi:hypothetical protein
VEVCGNKVDDNCNGVVDEKTACVACQNATSLTITSITASSAMLNWSATANPQQWQLQYKTTATGSQWVDVLLTGNIRSAKLTSLKANQTYNCHIRAKCNGTWTSYTGVTIFKTLAAGSVGTITYSTQQAAAGKEGLITTNKLQVYPNPGQGQYIIELKIEKPVTAEATLQVLDMRGQVVATQKAGLSNGYLQKQLLLSSTLSQGLYMVRITVQDKTYQAKLILQR